jgi:PIN domain nuclease of toxin-antitoxin system
MILLDTHAAIWLALEPQRLSKAARAAIEENAPAGPAISGQSLYEIARLIVRRRIALREPPETFLGGLASRFQVCPLTTDVAVAAARLPGEFPSDPFDRIPAATAIVAGVPLMTADRRIRRSRAMRTLW